MEIGLNLGARPFGAIGRTRRRAIGFAALAGATAAVAVASAGALLGRHPIFELLTHFRLQYVVVAAGCGIGLLGLRAFRTSAVAVACVAVNAAYLVPFYAHARPVPAEPPAADHIRLMLANVYLGNSDYEALVAQVRDERPDVLVLEELTGSWWKHVGELRRTYPYVNALPRPGGSGIAIFSRLPMRETEVLTYDASTMPGMFAELDLGGRPFSVLALHPPTPMRPDKFRFRNRQFALAAKRIRETDGPRVLIGDLNTTPFSPFFQDLVRESGLRDARVGAGMWTTWPMPLPWFLRIPLDHCLTSEDVRVEAIRAGGRTGSDHRPLVVDVAVAR